MGVGGQHHAPAALPPGKTRYPLYRRLGRPQGRSGLVWKISSPLGFDPRTFQPVTTLYRLDDTLSRPMYIYIYVLDYSLLSFSWPMQSLDNIYSSFFRLWLGPADTKSGEDTVPISQYNCMSFYIRWIYYKPYAAYVYIWSVDWPCFGEVSCVVALSCFPVRTRILAFQVLFQRLVSFIPVRLSLSNIHRLCYIMFMFVLLVVYMSVL